MCSTETAPYSINAAGDRWRPGHPRYDAAARELALRKCRTEAREVQDRAFKIKLLRQDKALESGVRATKLGRRIGKLRE